LVTKKRFSANSDDPRPGASKGILRFDETARRFSPDTMLTPLFAKGS